MVHDERHVLITGLSGLVPAALAVRMPNEYSRVTCDENESAAGVTDLIHSDAVVEEPSGNGGEASALIRSNVIGAIALIRRLPELRWICYLSSMEVYGPPQHAPFQETDLTVPDTVRGVAQVAVENLLRLHAIRSGLGLLILRLPSVSGSSAGDENAHAETIMRLVRSRSSGLYNITTLRESTRSR